MPDSLEARRLLELLYQGRTDAHLQTLIRVFTGDNFWVNIPMTVVAGGQVIRGQLTSPERFATDVEGFLERLISRANFGGQQEPLSEEQLTKWRKAIIDAIKGSFTERVARVRRLDKRGAAALEQQWGEMDPDKIYDIDELPEDVAKEAIAYRAPESAFALSDAEVLVGPTWRQVGTVRILINQVAAWWLTEDVAGPAATGPTPAA